MEESEFYVIVCVPPGIVILVGSLGGIVLFVLTDISRVLVGFVIAGSVLIAAVAGGLVAWLAHNERARWG